MQNVFTRVEGSQCKSLHTIRCKTPSAISLPLYTHSAESTRPAARVKTTRKYSSLVLSVVCCLIVEVSCWLVSEYREYHHNHHHHHYRSLPHHFHCHHHHHIRILNAKYFRGIRRAASDLCHQFNAFYTEEEVSQRFSPNLF